MTLTPVPSPVSWRWCRFEALSVHELNNIFMARQQVFSLEQQCVYLDADGFDEHSHHLAAWSPAERVPLAYARVVAPGLDVFTDAPLRDRAQRVAAVASVRGRGQVDLNTPMAKGPQRRNAGVPAGLPPEEAARQLKWAVELLAQHHQAKADDPAGASLYGEGLAVQGKTAEAGKILEDLATRDLVPDAFGWRALAQVRAATGNAAGRDAALEKCRAVAVKADLCALDPGVGGT